jgi:hypothetical protein
MSEPTGVPKQNPPQYMIEFYNAVHGMISANPDPEARTHLFQILDGMKDQILDPQPVVDPTQE